MNRLRLESYRLREADAIRQDPGVLGGFPLAIKRFFTKYFYLTKLLHYYQ